MRAQIINLGKSLVNELGLEQSTDTLGRWMAHYIAERITRAENTTGHDKSQAEHDCFEAILKLWQKRSSLPDGRRPLESFEPILCTLVRLDPDNEDSYFWNNSFDRKKTAQDELTVIPVSVRQWLDVAFEIDQVARVWLEAVLKQATLCAADEKTIVWLKHSVDLKDKDDLATIIRSLSDDILNDDDEILIDNVKQQKRELIISRIKKLEYFSSLNEKLLAIFNQELDDLAPDSSLKEHD